MIAMKRANVNSLPFSMTLNCTVYFRLILREAENQGQSNVDISCYFKCPWVGPESFKRAGRAAVASTILGTQF